MGNLKTQHAETADRQKAPELSVRAEDHQRASAPVRFFGRGWFSVKIIEYGGGV